MERLSYRQAYDKILAAYFKDEIKPYDMQFCFCGTLAWAGSRGDGTWWKQDDYDMSELKEMEKPLLEIVRNETVGSDACPIYASVSGATETDRLRNKIKNHHNYETALFNGMCKSLEILRQIHIDRGENVDEDTPAFTKRELA